MNPEIISVIVPVYNPDESFCKTIQSVLNQTYSYFELVIVDDGSGMDLTPVINGFNDRRIIYHKLAHRNANVARNWGISTSNGKYIAMLDSDDLWMANHLDDCLKTLRESDSDGLYGSLLLRDMKGKDQPFYVRALNKDEKMINYLLRSGYGAQTSTLFLTSVSAKDIMWDPSLNRHQDYDFVVRYSKQYKLIPKEKPTVIYCYSSKEKTIDFKSCMRFIQSNRDDIEPQLYNNYNLNMLMLAKSKNAAPGIINYYLKQATRYKEYLSYHTYIMLKYPESRYEKLKCKLAYLFYILQIKVE